MKPGTDIYNQQRRQRLYDVTSPSFLSIVWLVFVIFRIKVTVLKWKLL